MSLLALPDELLCSIVERLSLLDILRTQQTCSRLHRAVKTSAAIQYVVEAEVAGMKDHSILPRGSGDRLQLLLHGEAAWSSLEITEPVHLSVFDRPSGIYDLSGGTLLLGKRDDRGLFPPRTCAVHTVDVRDVLDGAHANRGAEWTTINLDQFIVDVGLAIQEHDLIAVVTAGFLNGLREFPLTEEIHLLKHSTSAPHPAAKQPVISIVCKTDPQYLSYWGAMVEISGDNLYIIIADWESFGVYNWKTGQQLAVGPSTASDGIPYDGLVILTPEIVALPTISGNTLEIWRLPNDSTRDAASPDPPPMVHLGDLDLPEIGQGGVLHRLDARAEPNSTMPSSPATHCDARVPFRPDATDAVMVLHLHTIPPGDVMGAHIQAYTMIVHRSALVRTIEERFADADASDAEDAPHVPWADWGPPICRWFRTDTSNTRWITTSCGQRWALLDATLLRVYDFNRLRISRALARGTAEESKREGDEAEREHEGQMRVVTRPSWLEPREGETFPFASPVESRLPYSVVCRTMDRGYGSILMDEDVLVGLKLRSQAQGGGIETVGFHRVG